MDPLADQSTLDTLQHPQIDPAIIDHNYISTSESQGVEIQGNSNQELVLTENSKKDQEYPQNQQVLENVRKELCRLCGQKRAFLKPIFEISTGVTSEEMSLSAKIEMYLPFEVKNDDPLPAQICSNCFDVLNLWHDLHVTCVAADAILWKTFGNEYKKSSGGDLEDAGKRVYKEVLQDMTNIDPPVDAEFHQEAEEPNPSDETNEPNQETNEEINANCGERKTLGSQKDEDSFIEKLNMSFEKNYLPYKCKYCYEFFMNTTLRREHIAMCRQMSAVCELCGKEIPCRKDLQRHKSRKHVKHILYKMCDKCGEKFLSSEKLSRHMWRFHEPNKSAKYPCEFCCIAFLHEPQYKAHMKKHEKGHIKPCLQIESFKTEVSENQFVYSCSVCQQIFKDVLSLVIHLTTRKKMKCPTCLKELYSEKKFLLHLCQEWTCQYCCKTFVNKKKWIVHERCHTGEKPIKCRKCDLTFHSFEKRRQHERSHESSFHCCYCGKSFRGKYVFRDHVESHEGKVFSCRICNKNFSNRRSVYKHTYIYHKKNKV